MAQPHYVSETQTLRRVACNPQCRLVFTTHAKERMAERDILAPDVMNVLTKGQVVLSELKQDDVWRVIGSDIDGRRLTVEAVVYEQAIKVKVVTAF